MVATGHATIYTWTCVGSEPRIAQAEKLDPRGFIAVQWALSENKLRTRPVRNTVRGPDPVVQVSDKSGACHAATRRSNRSQYANLNIFSLLHYIHKVLV